jgi:hypothetical protein
LLARVVEIPQGCVDDVFSDAIRHRVIVARTLDRGVSRTPVVDLKRCAATIVSGPDLTASLTASARDDHVAMPHLAG